MTTTSTAPRVLEADTSIILERIEWDLYARLSDADERRRVKMIYVDGRLTLVSEGDEPIVLDRIDWDLYARLADADDGRRVRMIYLDGRLTFVSLRLRHDLSIVVIDQLIIALAQGSGLNWSAAGQSTFKVAELGFGVEADRSYYFGGNADRMRGAQEIDLIVQPPPDLAVEVELTHPAAEAMVTYGRLGVPEVWRYDARRGALTIWRRRDDGTYAPADRSAFFPLLEPGDVGSQVRMADELGIGPWHAQLGGWVREVVLARGGGA